MEISCSKASAALVKHMVELPIEYVALEYGVNSPASDAISTIKSTPTLRRFKLGGATLAEPDLVSLAGATQLEELSVGTLNLPDERLPQLRAFSFLKSLRLVPDKKNPFSLENQAKLKALLPQTRLEFQ